MHRDFHSNEGQLQKRLINEIFDVRLRSSQMSLAHISQEFYLYKSKLQ